ncbi:hypothetical protein AB0B54_16605 [Microbispora bryophytorum]|uniref:hypothetical protein n=1 Tax=Microbispora bryophytorum TaxID=1460882 RepID=UPI0033F2E0E5
MPESAETERLRQVVDEVVHDRFCMTRRDSTPPPRTSTCRPRPSPSGPAHEKEEG